MVTEMEMEIERHMRIAFCDLTCLREAEAIAIGKNDKGELILPDRNESLDWLARNISLIN